MSANPLDLALYLSSSTVVKRTLLLTTLYVAGGTIVSILGVPTVTIATAVIWFS